MLHVCHYGQGVSYPYINFDTEFNPHSFGWLKMASMLPPSLKNIGNQWSAQWLALSLLGHVLFPTHPATPPILKNMLLTKINKTTAIKQF